MFESFTLVSVWWNGADVGEVGVRQPTRKSVDLSQQFTAPPSQEGHSWGTGNPLNRLKTVPRPIVRTGDVCLPDLSTQTCLLMLLLFLFCLSKVY